MRYAYQAYISLQYVHYFVGRIRRKVEEIVKALSSGETVDSGGKKIKPKGSKLSEEYTLLQSHLCGFFGSKVQLSCTAKGKGKISIPFNNEEDLERIMEILDSLKKKE